MSNNGKPVSPVVAEATRIMNEPAAGRKINRLIIGCIPFTAVPFQGPDMLIAFGRLVGYSLLAYATFNRMRPVSYVFMGAAGVSLATSLLAGWGKKGVEQEQ
jgi:hypothetical protein